MAATGRKADSSLTLVMTIFFFARCLESSQCAGAPRLAVFRTRLQTSTQLHPGFERRETWGTHQVLPMVHQSDGLQHHIGGDGERLRA